MRKPRLRRWWLKAVIQGSLSLVPSAQSVWLNYLFQRYVARSLSLSRPQIERGLKSYAMHLQRYAHYSDPAKPHFTALELGTGCFPVFPIVLALCGAEKVWSYDINSLLREKNVRRVLQLLSELDDLGDLARLLPCIDPGRIERLRDVLNDHRTTDPVELLARLGVVTIVGDIRQSELAPGTVDLISSNSTFEHIPEAALRGILTKFHELLSVGGVMSHSIAVNDHYADFDQSISPLNFYRFSDRAWKWFNNSLLYQNRLRPIDYRALHENGGFTVVSQEGRSAGSEALEHVPIADRFTGYSHEQLSFLNTWIVSRKGAL